MIIGQYSPALYATVAATAGLLSIIICQILAVRLGHEPPFPKAYITQTASHYPQYIFFRIGTISGSVFIILAHFTNYFWIKAISYESVFRINKYYPKVSLIFGIMGGLFLIVSTMAIDTGRTFDNLHNWCASSFFIFTILACLYNTFICYVLYSKTDRISKISMYTKLAFVFAFLIQFVIGTQAGYYQNFSNYMQLKDDLSRILEYTLAFTILGYFYTMADDVKKFKFVYENKRNSEIDCY